MRINSYNDDELIVGSKDFDRETRKVREGSAEIYDSKGG